MSTFRSIDMLIQALDREKDLLREMFEKRKTTSFRYDYALELTDYKEERVRYLIEYGVIHDTGDFLEMEDIYLQFFEEVLQVNEQINVSYVRDYLQRINENIRYYLDERNERRKYGYKQEVLRCLKTISLTTIRNVVDVKRNMDNTYKNEPTYKVKKAKLNDLSEKLHNITLLITQTEKLIEHDTFFKVALDVHMRNLINDVRLQLQDSSHNLIEIHRQIIQYLNLIDFQNQIFEKVRKLKYLKDQFLLKEHTDVLNQLAHRNPVCMEPLSRARIKLSIDLLRTNQDVFELIQKLVIRRKNKTFRNHNLADAIPQDFLKKRLQPINVVSLRNLYYSFAASGEDLFDFVMNYKYPTVQTEEQRLVYFCQLASQYADDLNFTNDYQTSANVEYPIIYAK